MGRINKLLKVSVIIPAYNEETRIVDCLEALMKQTVRPHEIIVVDNNCTDKTAEIALNYKGVTIVKESIQGRAPARDRGFNYATGDILARFDADTILPPNWMERVTAEFTKDPKLSGISGYGVARLCVNVPKALWSFVSRIWSWVYFAHCKAFFGVEIMWGGNMAIRRSDWLKMRSLCFSSEEGIHEDQDISLALASIGGKVKIIPSLVVSVDFYETEYFSRFWRYIMMKRLDRKLHRAHPRSHLITMRRISWSKRFIYNLITTPIEITYLLITLFNSVTRYISVGTKRLFSKS